MDTIAVDGLRIGLRYLIAGAIRGGQSRRRRGASNLREAVRGRRPRALRPVSVGIAQRARGPDIIMKTRRCVSVYVCVFVSTGMYLCVSL